MLNIIYKVFKVIKKFLQKKLEFNLGYKSNIFILIKIFKLNFLIINIFLKT